jgi:molybdopterin synthase catalytic subunit
VEAPASCAYDARVIDPGDSSDWLALTDEPLSYPAALEWVSGGRWGGVVGFSGVVRDHAEGRTGVTAIDYEAYDEHVLAKLTELAAGARERWPDVGRIVIWHRLGRVSTGESSVVIAVSTPHRAEAFAACRHLIDSLKETVPIWKREHWSGGSDWSPASKALRPSPIGEESGRR